MQLKLAKTIHSANESQNIVTSHHKRAMMVLDHSPEFLLALQISKAESTECIMGGFAKLL